MPSRWKIALLLLASAVLLSQQNRFFIEVFSSDGKSRRVDVTVENGPAFDLRQRAYGKGNQLQVDKEDFPTLARTGLHAEAELAAVKTIAGRPVEEINRAAQPGASSTAGFLAAGQDILSVLRADNRTVAKLGLTHAQLAAPLFHIWNLRLAQLDSERGGERWDVHHINYNGREILVEVTATRGFQPSIFQDEIQGSSELVLRREPKPEEVRFLEARYGNSAAPGLLARLSAIHTGEMVPYYTMRYGFYEGHTSYRADPIVIAFIFGLRPIEEIERALPGGLDELLAKLIPVS